MTVKTFAKRLVFGLACLLSFSSAHALFHDEWTTYFFRNSETGALKSFTVAWDAYGGPFAESTTTLFSKEEIPTKNVFAGWDYVGYGHFNRWFRDCSLFPDIGKQQNSFAKPPVLHDDECVYPKVREFWYLDLLGGIWFFESLISMIVYLSPSFLFVSFYVFFVSASLVRFLRITRFLPTVRAAILSLTVFWIFSWDFLYGQNYNQFDVGIYAVFLLLTSGLFMSWFSRHFNLDRLKETRFFWLARYGIIQVSAFLALAWCMRLLLWEGIHGRFLASVIFVFLIWVSVNRKFLVFAEPPGTWKPL